MAALQVPAALKTILPYLKIAQEYDKRDAVVAYYCRLHAVQKGIKIDSKSKDCKMFLLGLMDQLEKTKKGLSHEDAITNEIVAQAHVEEKAMQLFLWADTEDRAAVFNRNVVKSFYTASLLFDALTQFGELSEEVAGQLKYAKWKAAYINKCLKTGETPIPGPAGELEEGVPGAEGGFDSPSPQQPPYPTGPGGVPSYPPEQPSYPPVQPQIHQPRPVPAPRSTIPAEDNNAASSSGPGKLSSADNERAQKLCRFAVSALQYDDLSTAVDNLQKALALLQSNM